MTTTAPATSIGSTRPTLAALLRSGATRRAIESHLDGLAPYARVEQVTSVGGHLVGKLYDAVAGGEPLTLEDFVPRGENGTVIFEGKNSLPAFSRFQKRFARVGDVVVGYNHQTMAFATGPGYFVVQKPREGESHPDELYFDYTSEPPRGWPHDWPKYKPNTIGLSRAVYMNMKDFCRRVGNGVLVGKAYKLGVAQGAYFTLTRPT
jgi:hypothetical protein